MFGWRRNVITPRDAGVVVAVSGASAVLSITADVSPTGSAGIDIVITACLAFAVTWIGASTPWWALLMASGITFAAAIPGPPWAAVAAAAALGASAWLSIRKANRPPVRSLIAGACVNVVLWLEWDPPLVSSAVIGAAVVVLLSTGLFRRTRRVRRRGYWALGVLGLLTVVAVALLGVAGVQANEHAQSGYDKLLRGLELVRDGDTERGSLVLNEAAADLEEAHGQLTNPLGQPSRAVPIVAQNRETVVVVLDGAADAATAAASALAAADLDGLGVRRGRVDIDLLSTLSDPLSDLENAIDDLAVELAESNQSPWLLAPLATRIDEALVDIEQTAHQAHATALVAERGPAMLGADGPRRYLLAFVNSAESRATNGVMGNWSEITIDDGAMQVTASGRTNDLERPRLERLTLDASDDFLNRYGPLGADIEGHVVPKFWSNVSASPDMPSVGSAITQMYEQATRRQLDGVFVIDAAGLASLIDVTGSVRLDDIDVVLTADNAEEFLVREQYEFPEADREILLEEATVKTVANLLSTELPRPHELAATMSDAALNGHLSAWASRPEEQEVFTAVGMDASLPTVHGGARDALAVTSRNTALNKIDSFLERTIEYTPVYHSANGHVDATLRLTLHNTAPTSGVDDYVIGNRINEPRGTSATHVDVFTKLRVTAFRVDGEDLPYAYSEELGYSVYSHPVKIPSGGTVELEYELVGNVGYGDYSFTYRPQPLPTPDVLILDARDPEGEPITGYTGQVERRTVFSADGQSAWR